MSTQTGGTPGAAAPAAPAGSTQTHVTMSNTTDYQSQTPAAQPASADGQPADGQKPTIQQPEVSKPAETAPVNSADPAAPAADPAKPTDPAEFKLPDEHKDKPWAAKIKSLDDVYKQIDTLDALKGKKTIVPNLKEATPEDREAFYAQLRGKDASEYQIPKDTTVPIPDDTQPVVAKLFMDNGISPVQAESFLKGYLQLREKQIAQYYEPEGFKKSMETAFGADWEKTTGQVRNTIKGMMNADDQAALDKLPNHLLGVIYRTLGNTVKAYGVKETDTAHFGQGGKVAPTDVGNVRQGLRDQLAALTMRPHTSMEQQAIIDQLNDTYKNDPRLQSQA